jgi:hypothetical protein
MVQVVLILRDGLTQSSDGDVLSLRVPEDGSSLATAQPSAVARLLWLRRGRLARDLRLGRDSPPSSRCGAERGSLAQRMDISDGLSSSV